MVEKMSLDQALTVIAKELLNNKDNREALAAKADILYSMGLHESAISNRSLDRNLDNQFTEATKANAIKIAH